MQVRLMAPFDDTIFLKTQVEVLGLFDEEQLRKVTPDISRKTYSKGQTILMRGEIAEGLHIVKKGGAKVFSKSVKEPPVAELKPGDFFGEVSVLESATAEATVQSAEDGTEILNIPHDSFQKLIEMKPVLKKTLMDRIAARKAKK